MRHLLSVLLAIVLAPVIYVCAGFAAGYFDEATAGGTARIATGLLGLAAALVAGGLYAVLVMARLSPLGPVLAGLAYLGVTGWEVADPRGFVATMPANLFGVIDVLHAPVPLGTALLAVPLLGTVFSPRRWRGGERPAGYPFDAAGTYPPAPGSAAPTYGAPPAAPTYAPSTAFETTFVAPSPRQPEAQPGKRTGYTSPTYLDSSPSFPGFETPPRNPANGDDDPGRSRFM
jgi:hypothetical protein